MHEAHINVQKIAADPEHSVFLSASAGTGKTKVLCDRFINLMLSGSAPSKIMCITYTNSAAKEMLDRVTALAQNYSQLNDEEITNLFGEASANKVRNLYTEILFNKYDLKIQTLHSFCLEIITRYQKSNGMRNRALIDGAVKRRALKEIFYEISSNFLNLPEEISSAFIELTKHCAVSTIESRITNLMYETSELKEYLYTHTNLQEHIFFINEAEIDFDYQLQQNKIIEYTRQGFVQILRNLTKVDTKADSILQAIANADYEMLKKSLLTLDGKPRKLFYSKKALAADSRGLAAVSKLQQVVMEIEQRNRNYMFASLNLAFINLAKVMLVKYELLKTEKGYLDYDDIISEALNLLKSDPGILYHLDYEIDHILVDEAQDLSQKQWMLIEMLSSEFFAGVGARELRRTLFIVGDFKQSIFSFQGADPEIFKSKFHSFAALSSDASLWKNLTMNLSFRSEQSILDLANNIFPNFFQDYIEHMPYRSGPGYVELWPLIEPAPKQKSEIWDMPSKEIDVEDNHYQMAEFISAKVIGWLKSSHAKPADIMILVRKRSQMLDILAAKLRHAGFKVNTPKYGRFKDDLIIMDITSALEFALNPDDDLNLAGLLKSPFFGITEEKLFELAFNRKGTLLDSIKQKDPSLAANLEMIFTLFKELPILDALISLLSDTDPFVKRFGEPAKDTIDSFLEATHAFYKVQNGAGIKSFLDYLEFYQAPAAVHKADSDAIRIMTVHGAKGLQAPIVILADAASSEANSSDDVLFHEGELYFAVGAHQKSAHYESVLAAIKQASAEESKRLLYVAVTRAERELYVAGIKGRGHSWYDVISVK
ncbi:MAG: UvrD-helicase domain-containing protein [Candidatus Jidaibacter sp.]|jgi:ATP-dependent helicase/nuclease subunit A|nr:UvrD-helicase domain-containing protein [Candidatus Jidaibacter sp.]